MNHFNHYPSEPHNTRPLFFLAMKHYAMTAQYTWPLVLAFALCLWVAQFSSLITSTVIQTICSIIFILIGYLMINAMLWRGHQAYTGSKPWVLPPRRYWLNLCGIFLLLLIPAVVWEYCVKQSDPSQVVTLLVILGLSTILVFGYLLTLFVYPLLVLQVVSVGKALSISVRFVMDNWLRAGMIYILLMVAIILSLPASEHMTWLAHYYLNIPATLLILMLILPVLINFWLLLTNDNRLRFPEASNS